MAGGGFLGIFRNQEAIVSAELSGPGLDPYGQAVLVTIMSNNITSSPQKFSSEVTRAGPNLKNMRIVLKQVFHLCFRERTMANLIKFPRARL